MADMTRDEIVALAREHIGITSTTKGGLTDSQLYVKINHAMNRLCLLAEAPRTVYYLSTVFNSKYLPFDDQLLWITKVTFIPGTGNPYDLDLIYSAPFPTSAGNPRRYWHTAVNVPDANGRSTPTLGLDPVPQVVGANKNVRVEALQKAKDLAASDDVPELVSVLHPYIAAGLALDVLMVHPDRLRTVGPALEARFQEGVRMLRRLTHGVAKRPSVDSDTQRYTAIVGKRV